MAEKKPTHTFETIMKDIQARRFAPIYLLMGEESYYIDKISNYILETVLTPDERDFNQSILFGTDTTAVQVADHCREYPMMSTHRVVVIKEAQNIRSLEALEHYATQPTPSTILVLCYKNGTIDKRKKIVAKIEASGIIFESKKKKDYELDSFINNYLKLRRWIIDPKASQMMANHIGADLHRLTSELDKMMVAENEAEKRITPEMVEKKIGISKEFNVFELKTALINKDVLKANQIMNYFIKTPKSGSLYTCLPILFNFFQNLMIAYYAPNRADELSVANFLGLKSNWAAKEFILAMKNYSGVKTMQIISKIREIDAKSKGLDNPNTSAEELLKELIFFILH